MVFIIIIMEIDMMEDGKIIRKKEKEYFISIMEIYMMEISKIIFEKAEGYFILKMEIEKWEIGKMEKKLEIMHFYLMMARLN